MINFIKLKPANFVVFLLITCLICYLWKILFFDIPIDFWGIGLDSPVMSLSHALNIDYWLSSGTERVVSQPQTYHPGFFYQFISYFALKINFFNSDTIFYDRLDQMLIDPSSYWKIIQCIPLIFTILSFFIIYKYFIKSSWYILLIAFLSVFTLNSFYRFALYDLFNESFIFFFTTLFFIYLNYYFNNFKSTRRFSVSQTFCLGLISSFLYLNKMNYVLLVLPVFLVYFIEFIQSKDKKMILHFISLLTSIIFFIVFFSFILFDGFQGVQTMLHHHSNLIIFSGHYGGGERNIIDLSKFISSLKGSLPA